MEKDPKIITQITKQEVFKQELFKYYNTTYDDD